jgi:hypothetical protein
MAEAEIAYVAAAGAAGLALAVSAWGWRLRRSLAAREAAVEALAEQQIRAGIARDGASNAFEDLRIGLTEQGGVLSLAGPADTIAAARAALAPEVPVEPGEDEAVILAAAVHAAFPDAVRGLVERGEACDLLIDGADGRWTVEGRVAGGLAWLRLAGDEE